jgi:hypothetical protein
VKAKQRLSASVGGDLIEAAERAVARGRSGSVSACSLLPGEYAHAVIARDSLDAVRIAGS